MSRLSPDRQATAERTQVRLTDDDKIVVTMDPVAAFFMYMYVSNDPRPWNAHIKEGIGNIMDGAHEIFDRYGGR